MAKNPILSVRCHDCHHIQPGRPQYTACPRCQSKRLDAVYPTDQAEAWLQELDLEGPTMWRYRSRLPIIDPQHIISFGEGWTPLIRAQNLGLMLGHTNIYIKDERQGPTGSFKDRQAAVAVSAMKEAGIKEAVVASTGNVAIAYSAFCARAGIKLWAFVTSSVPPEKMREVAIYGTEVIKVAGTYDQAKKIAAQFARSKGIFLDQGIKTLAAKESMKSVAFEIAEQLGQLAAGNDPMSPNGSQVPWQVPDWFVQAVSGGMGPVGVMKGFAELNEMGITNKMPQLACFQAAGCAPMARAFQLGLEEAEPVHNPMTEITTLATGFPGDAYKVLRELILKHGGTIDAVTDADAFQALRLVARMDGFSIEPATAVAFAGLFNLIREQRIKPDEIVVINCSGHTFPVEKHILGEQFTRDLDANISEKTETSAGREEGLLTALEELDNRVKRIAIIEDNLDAARLIRRILQAQGNFIIDEEHDGLKGLELIQRSRPDLVILDLMMPGLDGFTVVERMKQNRQLQDIPIIVVTAKELTAVESKRLHGKIKALLQKGSFMDNDLIKDIEKALLP